MDARYIALVSKQTNAVARDAVALAREAANGNDPERARRSLTIAMSVKEAAQKSLTNFRLEIYKALQDLHKATQDLQGALHQLMLLGPPQGHVQALAGAAQTLAGAEQAPADATEPPAGVVETPAVVGETATENGLEVEILGNEATGIVQESES